MAPHLRLYHGPGVSRGQVRASGGAIGLVARARACVCARGKRRRVVGGIWENIHHKTDAPRCTRGCPQNLVGYTQAAAAAAARRGFRHPQPVAKES
jgi:hypothetical protein